MELHQLHMLRELGELGSIKAVADTLSVTPSAVSQQITSLQRQVDTPLTRKDGRNLVLTEAGKVLATAGAQVIDAMATAKAAIGAYQHDAGGTVTISGFHSAGQALFAPLVRRLAAAQSSPAQSSSLMFDAGHPPTISPEAVPRVKFSDEDVAQQDFPGLTARYDLVLAHRMDHSPEWPEERVTVIPLAHEPLDVAMAVDHPLAGRHSLTAADVVSFPWVSSRSGYSPADVLVAVGAMASRPVEVVHRINDYSTVAALVSTGEVIGLLPRYTSSPALNDGVVLRPLAGINTQRRIDLLVRPENYKRRSVQLVAQALQEVMAELAGG
ncbi:MULTISPECIES: LysR family transcriptional regulator [Arthrobacter]|uniref:LysR family transcriptional regulator n=1 Tax=Arthrobacter TaxID=1663 RepID=UPI000535CD07|nr:MULTISPECIES: LysR family transcriptional regulator [Arthrobacter]AIY03752.1 Transcriptional regulator, LysR family [Arthrobacter sp. PAMC 25486]